MALSSSFGAPDGVQPWSMIERLARTVGEPGFGEALLTSFDETLMISDCVAFVARRGQLSSAFEVSQSNTNELTHLIGRYLRHFPDRGRRLGFRKVAVPYHKVTCNHITDIDHVETSSFRRSFYDEGDFVDQAWSISRHEDGFIALCVFRRGVHGKFQEGQIEQFAQLAPVFMPFLSRHVSSSPALGVAGATISLDRAKAVIAAAHAALAPKEVEVCARILRGMTSEGIALDLNSSIHTVRTHRKRAYSKMQISSMAELFSRAIDAEQMVARGVLAVPMA